MKSIRVIRVGGSLLTWNPLRRTLESFLQQQSPAVNVFVCGGGPWVQLLRQRAHAWALDETESHWICVDALSTTAQLLAVGMRFPLLRRVDLSHIEGCQNCVLDVGPFLREEEPQVAGTPLLHTWDVTSDSIAARVAAACQADELVLLKSCDSSSDVAWDELAKLGIVDKFFPHVALQCKHVRLVNLRRLAES